MSNDPIHKFVSDNCIKFLGLAERCIIDFVTASASSSKTPEALFSTLTESGLPNTSDAHAFVTELYQRAPRKSKHKQKVAVDESAREQPEREACELTAKKYGFLLDEGMDTVKSVDKPSKHTGKEKQERRLRKRELDSKEWESDEEDMARKHHKSDVFPSRSWSRTPPDDAKQDIQEIEDLEARKEKDRVEDLKSRDKFAECMRKRNLEKMQKLIKDCSSRTSGPSAADAAMRRQLADDAEARGQALPSLRVHSRQEYLTLTTS